MATIKRAAVAAGTFAVALGTGFIMQNSDVLAARFTNETPAPTVKSNIVTPIGEGVPATVTLLAATTTAQNDAVAPMVTPAVPQIEIQQARLATPAVAAPAPVQAPAPMGEAELAAADECPVDLSLSVAPAAMVKATLTAPCQTLTAVTFHHQGMMFTGTTDANGDLSVDIPALTQNAVIIAAFDGGSGAMGAVAVPEVAEIDRAVLMWQADAGLQLHALEFGAGYGQDGHIWRETPRTVSAALENGQGFMTTLGEATVTGGQFAEVYTFPSGATARDGIINLSVEAKVTDATCGTEISAQSIQIAPGSPADAMDLALTVPGCDQVGEFLVLKNMFTDLRLAMK